MPEWLEEFTENLVDDIVPQHRDASSSSRELSSEPRAKVESGKRSILLISRRTKLRHLLENRNYKSSLQKRTGAVVPGAEHVGDLMTADHKVLSEEM